MSSVPCGRCGNVVPASAVVCPSCHSLVHAARLKQLAAEAQRLTAAGSHAEAVRVWREALPLLPPRSKQHAAVVAEIEAGVARMNEVERALVEQGPPPGSRWAKILAPLGAAG